MYPVIDKIQTDCSYLLTSFRVPSFPSSELHYLNYDIVYKKNIFSEQASGFMFENSEFHHLGTRNSKIARLGNRMLYIYPSHSDNEENRELGKKMIWLNFVTYERYS